MKQYLDLLQHIVDNGKFKGDRTNTGTVSVFGYQNRYDLNEGFPLVTTKKMHVKSIVHELLWFLKGDTNIRYLNDNGVHIWDEWADENGDLGPVYGKQWRKWISHVTVDNTIRGSGGFHVTAQSIDQLQSIINTIKDNPDSRRIIVSAWNPTDVDKMALPPCHCLFQFYVHDGILSCQLYQRSADAFLGVPFNIASYALLTYMVAQVTGLKVGEFIHTFGDLHIYSNHMIQVKQQLSRKPLPLPKLDFIHPPDDIFSFKYENIHIVDYLHHPAIKAPIAV